MRVRRAIGFSFAGRYGTLILRAAGLVVTARLLPPDAFGMFATAAALISLVFVFVEFGLHNYLIQTKRLGRQVVRTAVGVSLTVVSGALALIALPLWIFGGHWIEPGAVALLPLLCIAPATQPITLPIYAKLQRELRFDVLLRVDLLRAAASVGTTVGLALHGFGALSLAAGALMDAVVSILCAIALGRWRRPAWPSLRGWREPVRFGMPFAAVGGIGRAGDVGVTLVLGHALGITAVGLYNRALIITDMMDKALIQALSPVVLPALAQRLRDGHDLAPVYLRKIAYLTAIQWPFFAVLAALADPIVRVVLGPGWAAAVPVVQALALAGLFLPFTDLSLKFFVALGEQHRYVRIQAAATLVKLCLLTGLAFVSLPAAALGLALAGAIRAAIITTALKRRLGCRWSDLASPLARSAAVAVAAAVAPAVAATGVLGPLDPIGAGLSAVLAGVCWWIGLAITRHALHAELQRLSAGARQRLPPSLRRLVPG